MCCPGPFACCSPKLSLENWILCCLCKNFLEYPPNIGNSRNFNNSHSPQNSPWQSAVVEGFAEANSVFILITSTKIFLSKIYIQFTIFDIYFLTKLVFTNKRCHLHVLEKCLYMLQEVRSIIYFWQFIHPLSLCSRDNGTSFAFTLYIIVSGKFCDNFHFVSFFLPFVHLPAPKKNKTLSKSYLYNIFIVY